MTINSMKVETVYEIEYTFEEFISAAKKYGWLYERAFKVNGQSVLDMDETEQHDVFSAIAIHVGLHGDTFKAIARELGFDGWKNAGFYLPEKGVRTMVVYKSGDALNK